MSTRRQNPLPAVATALFAAVGGQALGSGLQWVVSRFRPRPPRGQHAVRLAPENGGYRWIVAAHDQIEEGWEQTYEDAAVAAKQIVDRLA